MYKQDVNSFKILAITSVIQYNKCVYCFEQVKKMRNLILRNTPDIADVFELREIESAGGFDTYEVFCENGKIVICGNCKISQSMGYYSYLKKY